MKVLSNLYPTLFGLFFPLALYARNASEVAIRDLILPISFIVAVTAFAQIGLRLLNCDLSKQNIVISACWLMFFFYSSVHDFVQVRHRYLIAAMAAALAALVWLIRRLSRQDIVMATRVLVLMAVILIGNPLRVLVVDFWHDLFRHDLSAKPTPNQLRSGVTEPGSTPPDIYYIILDGYAGQATLRKIFDFDNQLFLSTLEEHGFYIASESRSNYPMTLPSIPSSMNMEYLHDMEFRLGHDLDARELRELIFNGRVASSLKAHGYEFFYIDTSTHLRAVNVKIVDGYLQYYQISQYAATLLSFTILRHWVGNGSIILSYTVDGKPWVPDSIAWAFQQNRRLSQRQGPKFVFTHILSPHSPYYHDESCNVIPAYQRQAWNGFDGEFEKYKKAYIGQLQCVNRQVTALVSDLFASGNRNAIIVLQADHGPPEISAASILRHDPDTDLNLFRYHILNAYYVPKEIKSKLYPSISPVNTFRLIFNAIFHETNDLLPDQILEVRKSE